MNEMAIKLLYLECNIVQQVNPEQRDRNSCEVCTICMESMESRSFSKLISYHISHPACLANRQWYSDRCL